jgi:hypothetical protein
MPQPAYAPAITPPAPSRRTAIVVVATLVAIGGLIAVAAAVSADSSGLKEAADTCDMSVNLEDGGDSITFDTVGETDTFGDDITDVACVLTELDVPESVIHQMDATRALDGMQTASWGDYTAKWNYHPDNGMWLTITAQ